MKGTVCRYRLFTLLGTLAACAYPLWMGVSVLRDTVTQGTVYETDYPKYIIPYTPLAAALLFGVVLLVLLCRKTNKAILPSVSAASFALFAAAEFALERGITVTRVETEQFPTVTSVLQDYQMYSCIASPSSFQVRWETKTTEVEILAGDYSPTFKIHFYLIAAVLLLGLLACVYGLGRVVCHKEKERLRPLVMQSASCLLFLGLCILACFTAFFRTGERLVSPLSACLMAGFFLLLGVNVGLLLGSFLLKAKRAVAVAVPSAAASAVTLLMYVGELCLLDGNLYLLGRGAFFEMLSFLPFSPADLLIILFAGGVTAAAMLLPAKKKDR